MSQHFDPYQAVTDTIVAALEKGNVGQWQMPWHRTGAALDEPRNVTGYPYRGSNVVTLWIAAAANGYTSPVWASYKQWTAAGAQVRKGEHGTMVVLWKPYHVTPKPAAEGEKEDDGQRLVIRAFTVFNAAQVDGWTPPEAKPGSGLDEAARVGNADQFFANLGAKLAHGGDRAYYRPSTDEIQMPEFAQFKHPVDYYSTLGHEHIHWTGAKSRLDRNLNTGRFGDEAYAFEELVAEWGAAFLCAKLGLSNEPRQDHAQYLNSWLKVLKSDKKALFTAASKAQAAVDWLIKHQPNAEDALAEEEAA